MGIFSRGSEFSKGFDARYKGLTWGDVPDSTGLWPMSAAKNLGIYTKEWDVFTPEEISIRVVEFMNNRVIEDRL